MMTSKQSWAAALLLAAVCSVSVAQEPLVQVNDAWVRQAVKGQSGTGGFMTLTSRVPLTLVGFRSPVAASAELHEMSMQGDVMRMRAIDALPLPAGKLVALQPGGHHLMLMGLTRPLSVGDHLQLTLKLRDGKGQMIKQTIRVPVLATAPAATASQPH
ncbi:copper chaperone PCu(A)C [Aquabacterium sp.]|uniref:copper chaperone PCu(A)C n=1 Tax=Aquabacterium sp. TaxID=1872578 RepID=UPI0025C6EF4E|nr:copper chaperone PCu(A)C [Aquabacterium sp.]